MRARTSGAQVLELGRLLQLQGVQANRSFRLVATFQVFSFRWVDFQAV